MKEVDKAVLFHIMTPMVQAWLWTRDPCLSKDYFFVDAMTNTLLSIEKSHILNLLQVKNIEETFDYLLDQAFAETISDAKIPNLEGE